MTTPFRLPRRPRWVQRPLLAAAAAILSLTLGLSLVGAAPRGAPRAAPGPVTGVTCAPSCDLYAVTGTLPAADLPGAPAAGIPIYGYNTTSASVTAPGGPTLIANEGDAVAITLHNGLPTASSLMIAGQPIVPDLVGATAGGTKTYSIPANTLKAGTYLYEAGLTADGPRQAAMGLYGALIVRPAGAPLQAYSNANTVFNDEAVLVLSEIDPAFNANPATASLTDYAPKFWLINGKAFPNTATVDVAGGNKVLLRYVNAGLRHHSMALLGLHQTIIATAAKPATKQSAVVAETVLAGSTLDTLVSVPNTAGARFAVFDAATRLDNNGARNGAGAGAQVSFGGMLTFIKVAGTGTGGGGPVTSGVSLSLNPSNGSAPVTLSASFAGGATAAEYFVDTVGASGSGCPVALTSPNATIPTAGPVAAGCADLMTLASGNHTFYVHATNGTTWGAVASAVLNLDKAGPTIGNTALTPGRTNGAASVQIQASASDAASGNQNVDAAEYNIDGGAATPFTISTPATTVNLSAAIPTSALAPLADGNHAVNVRARDALGNWGALTPITLVVDKTGPVTSLVSITPNPANGVVGVQVGSGGGFYERVDATVTDATVGGVNSNIAAAEYFVDTVGAAGSGPLMLSVDGNFNSSSEKVYAAIDLYVINQLAAGQHTLYVRGKDTAGNWGATTSIPFVVDKTAPAISTLTTAPSPANLAATITASIVAADPASPIASNIVSGEFFWGATDPGAGLGTAFTFAAPAPNGTFSAVIDVSARTVFTNNTLNVRVKDAAGNWSALKTATISIDRIFASNFATSTAPFGWSATGGTAARLSVSASKLSASVASGNSGYVVNTLPSAQTSYRARFYVNPNAAPLGSATPTIFAAMNGNTQVFAVQMQRTSAGQYQVRVVRGSSSSSWANITGRTAIEVARSGGTVSLFIGGSTTVAGTVTGATGTINAARLGLSAGVTSAINGSTIVFDSFVSSRTIVIGP